MIAIYLLRVLALFSVIRGLTVAALPWMLEHHFVHGL
jgi:hypothetical protein